MQRITYGSQYIKKKKKKQRDIGISVFHADIMTVHSKTTFIERLSDNIKDVHLYLRLRYAFYMYHICGSLLHV